MSVLRNIWVTGPLLAFSIGLTGCGGDKDGPGTIDTDPPTPPPNFTLKPVVSATGFTAALPPEAIEAQQVVNTFTSTVSTVVADEKVQDRLNSNGGGDFRYGLLDCWTRPDNPMFSFSIDYTGCSSFEMGGGVYVADHPSGPVLFEFLNFQLSDRTIGGTMALDTRDAFNSPLFWQVYNTDSTSPGLENPVQIGVTLDGSNRGLAYVGGASIDFLNQEWAIWGEATISGGDAPVTVIHGGRAPGDVDPDDPPGSDALKSSLNWLECRCPTSGLSTYEMEVDFTEVTVDIDDMETEPDGVDDPEIAIPVEHSVPGTAFVTHIGCGEYDVEFEAEATSVLLEKNRLLGAITHQCDILVINDAARCLALINAVNELGDMQVEVSQEEITSTAKLAVENGFDTLWCRQE